MERLFTFDDVLIEPGVSNVESRRNVRLNTCLGRIKLRIPVISANMETITETKMAASMQLAGGLGILHRFCSVNQNIGMINFMNEAAASSGVKPQYGVSIGVNDKEKERAEKLYEAGARIFCIDVAHGAQRKVVDQASWLKENDCNQDIEIIVGNFATSEQIDWFINHTCSDDFIFKVGIGPGSVCSTRMKTGVGVPQLYAIKECVENTGVDIIADGGIRYPGDIAKALAVGAKAVMLGGMLAGTDEAPGEISAEYEYDEFGGVSKSTMFKTYAGSAAVGYADGWRTSEGVVRVVECKGPVKNILKDIEGGLRSALTYVGARNLKDFKQKANLIFISNSSRIENTPHLKVGE